MPSFFSATLVALALGTVATSAGAQEPVSFHHLANGLQVLLIRSGGKTSTEVSMGYFVGFADDSLPGTAHLMEHIAMRETKSGPGLAARYAPLQISGGAITTEHLTLFGMSGRSDLALLDSMLSLQKQRMTELAISDNGLSTERRSVHTEVDGRIEEPWQTVLFPGHNRGTTNHSGIDLVTRAILQRFYSKYYIPQNAMLTVESSWPDTLVLDHVSRVFAGVPAGRGIVPAIERDKTPVTARRWSGLLPARGYGVALLVPGIQHPWSSLLDAAVAHMRSQQGRSDPGVQWQFKGSASPVRVLLLSISDTVRASARVAEAWQQLLNTIDTVNAPPPPAVDEIASQAFECAAASDWRYCFPEDSISTATRRELKHFLTSVADGDTSTLLWPTAKRAVPAPRYAVRRGLDLSMRVWHSPDKNATRWQSTPGGMEWAANPGGVNDSVFMMLVLAPGNTEPQLKDVATLELLASLWQSLRNPEGQRIDSLIQAEGVTLSVRPLPFPPLATGEDFRLLADRPTAIGLYGIEFQIVASRSKAGRALNMLHDALLRGRVEPSSFERTKAHQLQILALRDTTARAEVEVAARQHLVAMPTADHARVVPATLSDQIAQLQAINTADLAHLANSLVESGMGRLTVLGATTDSVASWLTASGLDVLHALKWTNSALQCGSTDTPARPITEKAKLTNSRLMVFSCSSAAIDAAALVANTVIGGSEDALLAHRLRSELGMAYSFRSQMIPWWGAQGGMWLLDIDTPLATIDSAMSEIRKVLGRAVSNGPSVQLFEASRQLVADKLRAANEEGSAWTREVFWKGSSPEAQAEVIDKVTIEQVRAALRKWWQPEMLQMFYARGGG